MEESQDGLEEKGTAVTLLETLSTKEGTLFQIRRFPSIPTFAFLYSRTYLFITSSELSLLILFALLHVPRNLPTWLKGVRDFDLSLWASSEHNIGIHAFFS
jgi:hypothetical protein